jgi:hypothetical protein
MLTLAKHFQFQADNSLTPKQLEGRKQNKERLTLAFCYNGDDSDKLLLWSSENTKISVASKMLTLAAYAALIEAMQRLG